jgi:hypothetical protein
VPRLRARIHAQRPKRAHARCTVFLRPRCQIARTWRTQTAPARGANDGRCAAATVYGTVLRGATSRDRPVPTRQRQREPVRARARPQSSELRSGERRELRMRIKGEQKRESRKHTESLFPEVRGHLITVHVHVQIGRNTKDMILKSDRSLRAHVATTHRPWYRGCASRRASL